MTRRSGCHRRTVSGTRIIFAVCARAQRRADRHSRRRRAQFVAFVQKLARDLPDGEGLRDRQRAEPAALLAAAVQPRRASRSRRRSTCRVLAGSYDALKAVDPTINVIGVGLSPRGNDNPQARRTTSRPRPSGSSPTSAAPTSASGRNDADHGRARVPPVPAAERRPARAWATRGRTPVSRTSTASSRRSGTRSTAPPSRSSRRRGKTFGRPLTLRSRRGRLAGLDPCRRSRRCTTAPRRRGQLVTRRRRRDTTPTRQRGCLRSRRVRMLSFFHLVDEPDLDRWQSGLERADGTARPSYDARQADASRRPTATARGGRPSSGRTRPASSAPAVASGNLASPRPAKQTRWSFTAGAAEEADLPGRDLPGQGRARTAIGTAARSAGRPSAAALRRTGAMKAQRRARRRSAAASSKPGRYVYAIRMTAAMNPERASFFVSKPFRVGAMPCHEHQRRPWRADPHERSAVDSARRADRRLLARPRARCSPRDRRAAAWRRRSPSRSTGAALAAGAHPYSNVEPERLPELLLAEGSDEQLDFLSPMRLARGRARRRDRHDLVGDEHALAQPRRPRAPPAAARDAAQLAKRRWERIASGELRWCGTLFPTQAHAQDAEMSLARVRALRLPARATC